LDNAAGRIAAGKRHTISRFQIAAPVITRLRVSHHFRMIAGMVATVNTVTTVETGYPPLQSREGRAN
jgi:hypothetical protein